MKNLRILFMALLFVVATAVRASGGNVVDSTYDPTKVLPPDTERALLFDFGKSTPAKKSPWAVNIWGMSYHTARPTQLNESNWGLGGRYYHGEHWFSEANAVYNSFKGLAATAGTGLDYSLIRVGDYSLHGEFQLMYAHYGYASYLHKKAKKGIIGFPQLALHRKNIALGITVVPRRKLREVEAYLFHIMYRF